MWLPYKSCLTGSLQGRAWLTLRLETPAVTLSVHCSADTAVPAAGASDRFVETGLEAAVTDDRVKDCAAKVVDKHPAANEIRNKDLMFRPAGTELCSTVSIYVCLHTSA